ncbi:MAG: SDR family oxidoreductase [Acidobacteriales bacterium]|nr:SDR family oxidoreductase [Terriglobales bacterium]
MASESLPLSNKIAIVTGASRGIGRAIALELASLGAYVIAAARDQQQLESLAEDARPFSGTIEPVRHDVTRAQDWQSIATQIRSKHSRLDVLVNNAGVGDFGKPLHETSEEQFDRMIATNLRGVFLGMKYLTPLLIDSGGGDIVNISSIASKNGVKNAAVYAATKWAVNGLSASAFEEVRDHRIRISVVCPGSVATELILGMNPNTERMLQPEDIAHAVTGIVTQAPQSFISEVVIRPTLKP